MSLDLLGAERIVVPKISLADIAAARAKSAAAAAVPAAPSATPDAPLVASDEGKKGGKGDKGTTDDKGSHSWFTKKIVGPIPTYGVMAMGVGVLGIVGVVVKKVFFKK